jgi:hypothetical protein
MMLSFLFTNVVQLYTLLDIAPIFAIRKAVHGLKEV